MAFRLSIKNGWPSAIWNMGNFYCRVITRRGERMAIENNTTQSAPNRYAWEQKGRTDQKKKKMLAFRVFAWRIVINRSIRWRITAAHNEKMFSWIDRRMKAWGGMRIMASKYSTICYNDVICHETTTFSCESMLCALIWVYTCPSVRQ